MSNNQGSTLYKAMFSRDVGGKPANFPLFRTSSGVSPGIYQCREGWWTLPDVLILFGKFEVIPYIMSSFDSTISEEESPPSRIALIICVNSSVLFYRPEYNDFWVYRQATTIQFQVGLENWLFPGKYRINLRKSNWFRWTIECFLR